MKSIIFLYFALSVSSAFKLNEQRAVYLDKRKVFLDTECRQFLGCKILLSEQEVKLNEIFVSLRNNDTKETRTNTSYPPSIHFFKAKDFINRSNLFKLLKSLPKGKKLIENRCTFQG